jgi:inner membrane protein
MEPVTHILSGAVTAKLGFKRRYAFGILVFVSVAPDLDYLTRFWGVDVFLRYHRGISHGVLALTLVPFLVALLFGLRKGFLYYYFTAFVGYALHLALDLVNQYGTRVLSPLDWSQFSYNLVAIVDPYILSMFLVGLLVARRSRRPALIALVTFMLVFSYIGLRAYLYDRTMGYLQRNLTANKYTLCPLPNDFLRWWFIAETKEEVLSGFADLFTQRVHVDRRYPKYVPGQDPVVEASKKSRVVKNFLYFAKYPYPEVSQEGGRRLVLWKELSYSYLPGRRFTATVEMSPDGKGLQKAYFRF